jgi:cobalt-zinc-cadmium efflux system outer membrane protein
VKCLFKKKVFSMRIIFLGIFALAVTVFTSCASLPNNTPQTPSDQSHSYLKPATVPVQKLTGELTLDMALSASRSANPTLTTASFRIKAAEAAVRQSGVLPNPELSTEFSEFGGSDDRSGTRAMESTIGISQEIQLGGKRKRRVELAQKELAVVKIEHAEALLELDTRVRLAFLNVSTAQKDEVLAKKGLDLVRKTYDIVMKRIKSGDISPIQVNKVKVELASGRLGVVRAERQLSIARRELASLWGAREPHFSKVVDVPEHNPTVPDDDTFRTLLGEHPRALKLQAKVDKAKAAASLAKAEAWPDMEVSAGVSRFNETDDNAFSLGISFPLPFFNRNKGRIDESYAQIGEATSEKETSLLGMHRELTIVREKLSSSGIELKAFNDEIIPAAERSHEAVLKAFQTGDQEFLDVLDAQRTLLEAKQTTLSLTAEYRKLVIELDRITGKQITLPKK